MTHWRASDIVDKLNEGDTAMFDLGFIGLQNDWGDVEIILPLRKPKVRWVKDGDDVNRIRQAMEELKQASYAMSQQMYGQAQPQYGQPGGNGGEPRQGYGEEEDVVEGEFHAV